MKIISRDVHITDKSFKSNNKQTRYRGAYNKSGMHWMNREKYRKMITNPTKMGWNR